MSDVAILPPERDRVLICINPRAGKRSTRPLAERLAELLSQKGFNAKILVDRQDISDQAMRWQQAGTLRAVVAVGGDGTVAEIVNRTQADTPVALLPMGTENLLAKYLGTGFSVEEVCETIVRGATVRFDAGRATSQGTSDEPDGTFRRIFLLMASAGLDADVVHRLEQIRRGHISHWSYFKPIVQAVRSYQYPELRIDWRLADDAGVGSSVVSARLTARWMFLFNLPCYARGVKFTPDACGDDGRLDLCTFRRGSLWHGLKYLMAVLRGRHGKLADCTLQRVTGLRVEADIPVPFQLDGDFGGFLPLDIEVLPRRLTLLAPEGKWGSERGDSSAVIH